MVSILSEIGDYLGAFYNIYLKKNMKVVDGAYDIIKNGFGLSSINDFIKYLEKIIPSNIDVSSDNQYTIYFFDSVDKYRKKEIITFTEKECNHFNNLSNNNKSLFIINKIV